MKQETLLAAFPDAREDGDGWLARCPAHEDNKPSLRIAAGATGQWLLHCRAGCTHTEVKKAAGLSGYLTITGEVTINAVATPSPMPEGKRIEAAAGRYKAAQALAALPVDSTATMFLAERFGIDPGTLTAAKAFELGLGYDVEAHRVEFVARTADGTIAYWQTRSLDPTDRLRWLTPGGDDEGHRWDGVGYFGRVAHDRPVVVVEGPSDAMTLAVLDLYDVVGIRGAQQGARIAELADELAGRVVYVCGDGDDAGNRMHDSVASTLAERCDVRIVRMPRGMDVNDMRREVTTPDKPHAFAKAFAELLADSERPESEPPKAPELDWLAYDTNDLGLSRLIFDYLQATGRDVRDVPGRGVALYDGEIWRHDAATRVLGITHEIYDAVKLAADAAAEEVRAAFPIEPLDADPGKAERERHKAQKEAREAAWKAQVKPLEARAFMLGTVKHVNKAIDQLVAMPGVFGTEDTLAEFDASPTLIQFANGTVDARTGELRSPRKGDMISQRIKYDYRPDAPRERWEKFVREVFVTHDGQTDEELVAYMKRLSGYALVGGGAAQVFAILNGKGANGKSVYLETLRALFGPLARSTVWSTFEEKAGGAIRNDLARLAGARAVFASESAARAPLDEATVKRVTGLDTFTARFLHKEEIEFRATFLVMLATNDLPEIRGTDEGIWRRVRVVPFNRYFAPNERDEKLQASMLAQEAEGILAWVIEGAREYLANGLGSCAALDATHGEYRADQDRLGDFLSRCCLITGEHEDYATVAELFKAFKAIRKAEGDEVKISSRTFKHELLGGRRGVRSATVHKQAVARGLRFMPNAVLEIVHGMTTPEERMAGEMPDLIEQMRKSAERHKPRAV